MALEEQDREDLLRDGRMMPLRGECLIAGVTVVVGFRSRGQLSLYCGPDPVFQFNAERQLRRVYFQGRRFAAVNRRLVELTRQQRGGKVEFDSKPFDPATQAMILSCLSDWLGKIYDAARSNPNDWRSVDNNLDLFLSRLLDWFDQVSTDTPRIASAPNA